MRTRAAAALGEGSSGRARRTTRGERKRRQILDAAAKVLARRGYAATTLSEIAAEVGTAGAGSLYYHFESREQLIEELLRRGARVAYDRSRRAIEMLPREASALERLTAAIRAHLRCVLVESDYARAAVRSTGQVPAPMWARVNAEFRGYGRFYDRLIAAAMDAGEIDASVNRSSLRMLLIGASNWAPEWYRPQGRASAREIEDLVVRLLTTGVAAKATTF